MSDQHASAAAWELVQPSTAVANQPVIDVQQIIYALERAERRLQAEADALHEAHDYAAEFPAEDAERMREAQALLRLGMKK